MPDNLAPKQDADFIQLAVKVAKVHRTLYEAYVEQGFNETQALFLVAQHIASPSKGRKLQGTEE